MEILLEAKIDNFFPIFGQLLSKKYQNILGRGDGLVVGKHTLYSNDPSLLSYLLPNLQDDRFEVFGQIFKHLLSIWQNFESTYFVKSIAANEQILNKKSSHLAKFNLSGTLCCCYNWYRHCCCSSCWFRYCVLNVFVVAGVAAAVVVAVIAVVMFQLGSRYWVSFISSSLSSSQENQSRTKKSHKKHSQPDISFLPKFKVFLEITTKFG